MVLIKICGITNKADAKIVYKSGADIAGFVFYEKSPRKIDVNTAMCIMESISNLAFAGVFVNDGIDEVFKIAKKLNLDYLQFSGEESLDYLSQIKEKIKGIKRDLNLQSSINEGAVKGKKNITNIKIIKSIKIRDNFNFEDKIKLMDEIKIYTSIADFILLDSYSEKLYGGTGKTFNWELFKNIGKKFPIIISGGLDSSNVNDAISIVRPFGVDASSKLEKYPGKKDIKKVKEFINIIYKSY